MRKINRLPTIAGRMIFNNHIPAVATTIPAVLLVKLWNKYQPNPVLTPNSPNASDGTTDNIQKNNVTKQKPSIQGISMFIHLSKNKYCAE